LGRRRTVQIERTGGARNRSLLVGKGGGRVRKWKEGRKVMK